MLRKCFLLLFIVLACGQLFAQKVRVVGTVVDENNLALEFVSVSQNNTTNVTHSNLDGKYELTVSSQDTIRLLFSFLGYQKQQYIVPNVNTDKTIELNITLKKISEELSAVTVEAERTITTTIKNVNYLATKRPSNPWNSIESMLMTIGGVHTSNELSSQYSVRGGNFDENIVYVNGIEIHRPLLVRSAQQEGLSFINPSMVHAVNFSAGGFSAEYGDKMSSVLDITYKRPSEFEGAASVSMMGGDVYIGNSTNRFSQVTGIRYKTIRSLLKTTDTKAEYDPSFLDVQTYMTYDLSNKWGVSFSGNYSHNTYEFTPASRETTFGTLMAPKSFMVHFDGWEKDRFVTYQAAITLKGKVNDRLTLGFTGSTFSSDEQERYDIEGRYELKEADITGMNSSSILGVGTYHEHARNKLKSDVYTFSHFGNLKLDNHQIKWGVSYQRERIDDRIKEWEMRDSAGYSLPSTGTEVNLYSNLKSNNKVSPTRIFGYMQDTYTLDTEEGIIIFNAGIRANYWNFNKETTISPRGVLAFIPHSVPNLSFRLAGGVYYQAPFYKEVQYITEIGGNNIVTLNKEIKSQKSVHVVLGSDFFFGDKAETNSHLFKLSGEAYYKKLSDLIPYTINNVKIRYAGENIADGYIMGVDATLYGEFIPGADSWISLSFMKSEQDIQGVKVPLPTDQRFNLALFYQDYFPGYERLRMSLRGLWSHGLPVSAPHQGYESGYFRIPSYKRVDIGFAWQILGENFAIRRSNSFCKVFKNIWLVLDVFNIFDMQNTNTYYWVTDVHNMQYAVPNYLTGRQLNLKLLAEF